MGTPPLDDYAALVEQAGRFHGHVCRGIEIGTRMAMAGLKALGILDPRGTDRKKFIVFIETDRCATDAIMAVAGCSPGKRSLKVLDYGKLAATFVHLETHRAVRFVSLGPRGDEPQPEVATMSDDQLFTMAEVDVPLRPEDLPGKPARRAVCEACGERVLDGREVRDGGRVLCRPCAGGTRYYRPAEGRRT
jgi:formylmethanofuran dehydrogenase subunit E